MADVRTKQDYRPSWDEHFMGAAIMAAERASCLRHQFGAVVVMDKKIVGTGYNGAFRGFDSCYENGICRKHSYNIPDERKNSGICPAVHAEVNAVMQALANTQTQLGGATLYSLGFPCDLCSKEINNTGITRVVYMLEYNEPHSQTDIFSKERKPPIVLERLTTSYLEAKLDLMRKMRRGEFNRND